jgi:hypothetical protein
MEKFCEKHPEVAAVIIAPAIYFILVVAMSF